MGDKTSISVTNTQKSALIELRSELERRDREDISQGEAVRRGSRLALRHLENCRGEQDG